MQSKIKTYPVPEIAGAMLIEAQQFRDARGLFQKIYENSYSICWRLINYKVIWVDWSQTWESSCIFSF